MIRIILDTTNHSKLSDQGYQKWLQSLKDGDSILLQSFCQPYKYAGSYPFAFWQYESRKVEGSVLRGADSYPVNRNTGMVVYWGAEDKPCIQVFPQRIVPCMEYLVSELGCCKFSLNPVYEPLYTNNLEYYFSYQGDTPRDFRNEFDVYYYIDAMKFNEKLFVGYGNQFKNDKRRDRSYWDTWIKENNLEDSIRYLYSKDNSLR